MTKKDFIKKFNLKKAHKISFMDGRRYCERMMYTNDMGHKFVLYDNDLVTVKSCTLSNGKEHYSLGAGYSWYH